jgi:cell division protein FtsL
MYKGYKMQKEQEYRNSAQYKDSQKGKNGKGRRRHYRAIYAKFEKEISIGKKSLMIVSILLIFLINFPIIFNYIYTLNLEHELKDLRTVRN